MITISNNGATVVSSLRTDNPDKPGIRKRYQNRRDLAEEHRDKLGKLWAENPEQWRLKHEFPALAAVLDYCAKERDEVS